MKTKLMFASAVLLTAVSFTSCKKDYTCTCTTVVGGVSATNAHDVKDATLVDAKKTCNNYEDQANASFPGGTTCHL